MIEQHPLTPFLPANAKLLMLGSFPPQTKRWSMHFFYPNYINDMWRIYGLLFKGDKDAFVDIEHKTFKLDLLIPFLKAKGIALFDTAIKVRRLKDNASDKFLEVITPTDLPALFDQLPRLKAVVTTGQKATDTLLQAFNIKEPVVGTYETFQYAGKELRLYRMPSSSRAYPLKLEKKAEKYKVMFEDLGLL
ncbi:uracil-DNA glycosylase family protein [Alloprevotella tannerae]|jgi:mug protein|uniref:uracil-DNA glycosylase family protein n=1 Tax=Alloprevotella tannerae TaxID=76122 RepID=UPI001EDA93FD|nr:uracil-DNA glycosylase family protein [Alloprevotella tannerae]MCG2652996.1 uracil-DNA glycosylase family protein [Alloprevotella tannerae]